MDKWFRLRFQPCEPLGENGKKATACAAHTAFSRKAATEGMVLLKNNGILPFEKGKKIALFGKAQTDYVKAVGGSGDVFAPYIINFLDGLEEKAKAQKIDLFCGLSEFYRNQLEHTKEEPIIPENLFNEAVAFADTAIVAINRRAGEGDDLTLTEGKYYLSISEQALIEKITANFKDTVVLINSGSIIDSEWFAHNPKISATLLTWNGGMEGGGAAADILCGDSYPSGKLSDTMAKNCENLPAYEGFTESYAYVKYYEDIYVGYRYFETIPNASELVNYPFGFGLSYTTFELSDSSCWSDQEKIYVKTTVKNTGNFRGKEVVQIYYSAPQGVLGKPAKELGAFLKTSELEPNESETLSMSFAISDMASYDDVGKLQKSAYLLEKGTYTFHIGTSVRDTTEVPFTFTVSEDFRIVKQLSEQCPPYLLEKRLCADGTYEDMPKAMPKSPKYLESKQQVLFATVDDNSANRNIQLMDVAEGKATLDEFMSQLDSLYLADLVGGKACQSGIANTGIIGANEVSTSTGLDKYGVPRALTFDGPAGLRSRQRSKIPTTSFPCGTLLACTWNPEIATEFGRLGALEAKENNLSIWLAPGMNIHRTFLCGRNSEYYSEDPYLTGKMAAAFVCGAQSQGIAACPKHFACNNKEHHRAYSDSLVSERAIREIYLKGFEICVADADPWMIMTSYNMINGTHASENYDLLTEILRGEWDYQGAVTTDWCTNGNHIIELFAGNDVKMPYGEPTNSVVLRVGENSGRQELYQSAKRILSLLLKLD